jgi:predicted ATP-grasp superfamily ATP-dependent carboligase
LRAPSPELCAPEPRAPEPRAAILIAAASARALAGAARRAGYQPLVVDVFGDSDTCEAAVAHRLVEDGLLLGFRRETLLPALHALADRNDPIGLVYGAGYEDRTDLLDEIGASWRLLGNPPEVVRRVKDPIALAALCERLGLSHPETRLSRPADCAGWLAKTIGGSGGTHVVRADEARDDDAAIYYQRVAPGAPVSVLLLGDGAQGRVVGSSRQWAAPAHGEPFRYGGCLRPAELSSSLAERLDEVARTLTRACGLRGLNSIDLLVEGDDITLVEINPRPGATLDIFADDRGSLFRAHVEACLGRLPEESFRFAGAAAAAIAYARREIRSMPALDWPDWAADRQRPRTALHADAPLCTIKAYADQPSRARALVEERRCVILDTIDNLREGFST